MGLGKTRNFNHRSELSNTIQRKRQAVQFFHTSSNLVQRDEAPIVPLLMDIESVRCACCSLKEDCTQEYIDNVKGNFAGKWLCGLCSEAVRDELSKNRSSQDGIEEAIKNHMEFCRMPLSSPAVRVADGMKEMLRRRSGEKRRPATPSKAHQEYKGR